MNPSSAQVLENVSQISMKLMIGDRSQGIESEPFYGHFFTGMVKKITPQTETLAVGGYQNLVVLMINPDFWQSALDNDGFKVGAIKHEILHILFKHIFRHKDFSHKLIFNIAADLVVNQYIKSAHLISGAVHLEDFPELNLKPHQPLNAYYNALMELYQSRQNPGPGEGQTDSSQAWENLRKLLDQNDPNHQKHAFWQKIEELSSAERDILESAINQAIQNTLQNTKNEEIGHLPAALQRYLIELERSLAPVINWRRVLRLFTNSSSATRLQNTIRRPSKRYGTTPGIKVKKKQKILVALDTSGSIQTEELSQFFQEIYHIWKQGSEIRVVECDMKIQKAYAYKGKMPSLANGGGGTSFEAPLRYANTEYQPDALVYFTDGFGPAPETWCRCPVLWLISKEGATLEKMTRFPGRKVKMNT